MLWWEGSADGWDQLLPSLQAAKAETDDFCSPEEEEQDYFNHVPLHDTAAVGKEVNMSCVTEWMSRGHNSITTLYLALCWQWMTIGQGDHATSLPMRPPRGKGDERDPLVFTVSARKVHGRTAHYGWRRAIPRSWTDFNPTACNVLAELWLTDLLREGAKRPVSLIAGVDRRITPTIVGRLVECVQLELEAKELWSIVSAGVERKPTQNNPEGIKTRADAEKITAAEKAWRKRDATRFGGPAKPGKS